MRVTESLVGSGSVAERSFIRKIVTATVRQSKKPYSHGIEMKIESFLTGRDFDVIKPVVQKEMKRVKLFRCKGNRFDVEREFEKSRFRDRGFLAEKKCCDLIIAFDKEFFQKTPPFRAITTLCQ